MTPVEKYITNASTYNEFQMKCT